MTRVRALYLPFMLAAAWGAVSYAAGGAKESQATLRAITSRVSATSAELVIEASEPVPYISTRPDAYTVVLDFRNVAAAGVAKLATQDPTSPIVGVAVEAAESMGSPVSRVRISLSQPLMHRVRSERNNVVVDFDRAPGRIPYVTPPVPREAGQPQPRIDMPAIDPIAALGLSPAAQSPSAPASEPAARTPGSEGATPSTTPGVRDQLGMPHGVRKYTGNPVSLDFQQADLRAVLRVFAEISGLNIVIDPAVKGTVDVALKDVPWDHALEIILRANKLGYMVDGTIARIAPLTVLADEEAQQRKLVDEQALSGDLRVLTRTLSYAKAEDLKDLILNSTLSKRGTVQVDARTNMLIILDLQERLTAASDLIDTLDRPQPQVEIEARIVQTNKDYARALGVQWGFGGKLDPSLGNTTNLAFPNKGALQGAAGAVGSGTAVDLGVNGATSAVGLAMGSINGAFNLDVALSAAESTGNARLLSTPRVSTQNNVEAEIAQGVQIPYQTVANNTTTVNFKDAALTLRVTPQITAAGTVIMKIAVDNGSRGPDVGSPPMPSINTQRANTTVLVNDGQTTVIGGIYSSQENSVTDSTPGLSRVPLLRWLFKRDTINNTNSELLIFITPRIIKN